jgi:phosphotransferase system enzyme I (PtsP)
MFPMISSLEEFTAAKNLLVESHESLLHQNIPHNINPEIGMMAEVPSVVELIEDFSGISDFFSIGSNDLIQYILAVDRTNEKVADNYIPHHPAVLRSIYRIITGANKYERDISICGDMANKREYLTFLIGAGIRSISIEPDKFPRIQAEISKIDTAEAKIMVKNLLKVGSIHEIENILFGV